MHLLRIPNTQEHYFVLENYLHLSTSSNISDKEVDTGEALLVFEVFDRSHKTRASIFKTEKSLLFCFPDKSYFLNVGHSVGPSIKKERGTSNMKHETWIMEHSLTIRNIPEHPLISTSVKPTRNSSPTKDLFSLQKSILRLMFGQNIFDQRPLLKQKRANGYPVGSTRQVCHVLPRELYFLFRNSLD